MNLTLGGLSFLTIFITLQIVVFKIFTQLLGELQD